MKLSSVSTPSPVPAGTAESLRDVRVLILFGGWEIFGQERATIEVFRCLREKGLKARFVTSSRWGHHCIQPELDRMGLEWTTAPFGYRWDKSIFFKDVYKLAVNLWGLIGTTLCLISEVWHWKPTHIFVGNWLYLIYSFVFIQTTRVPIIFRAGDELPQRTLIHRILNRRLFGRVSKLVCNCDFLLNDLEETLGGDHLPRERYVIRNHPPKRMSGSRVSVPACPEDAIVILYVGQISEHKGVPLLIETVIRLIKEGENLVLWVVGGSQWQNNVSERARRDVRQNGVEDKVHFFGYVTDPTSFFETADIHVCPSIWPEPSPNVVFEAKSAAVPSVVFPVGGLPELIEHAVDGFVCRECSADALREGLRYFLGDQKRVQAAGGAAHRSLETRFGLARFQREWTEVFAGVGAD